MIDRDLVRGVALLDQQWAHAVDWFRGLSPRRMRQLSRVIVDDDREARQALLGMDDADLRMVLSALTLVVAECVLRMERGDTEGG